MRPTSTALPLADLRGLDTPVDVIIHSFEGSIYRASVVVYGLEHRLIENGDKALQRRSIHQVMEALEGLPIGRMVLRQQSAFDEMIGQATREGSNMLEVPLSTEDTAGTLHGRPSQVE